MLLCVSLTMQAGAAETTAIRRAAVAGMFYDRDARSLTQTVKTLMEQAGGVKIREPIRALIVPHAGYAYSGIVAAAGYGQIDPGVKTVILLGSSHRVALSQPSIPRVQAYETPLGRIPLAHVATQLMTGGDVTSVIEAHVAEHSLEVQLPFLQVALRDFDIVPILTNQGDPEALASKLAPFVDENTLVVASTDLSHYYSYDTAVSLDHICIKAVVSEDLTDMPLCQACGKQAMLTLMHLAQKKGWNANLIDYRNSGDTSGNKDRVVGYMTVAYVERKERPTAMSQDFSDEGKMALLKFVRSVIAAKLLGDVTVQRPSSPSPAMLEERGCFVTLHKKGRLRGCIGSIEPVSDLLTCVEDNAGNAAFRDPRFPALTQEELSEIDIEISVLTAPKRLRFKDGEDLKRQLTPHVHGVILSQGSHRATFLPQVWKQLPGKEQFLERLCVKGGMPPQAWKDPETKVKTYGAEVFGELDFQ